MTRKITEAIIHCAATKEGKDFTVKDIDRWHRQMGWDGCGYHYVVRLDGTIEKGRDMERVGAHCKGHNKQSVGICYIGGLKANGQPADTRTDAQKAALLALLKRLKAQYPALKVYGHRDFCNKACPCFDAREEYSSLE